MNRHGLEKGRKLFRLRGGVGAAGYVAEALEERRMLALVAPQLSSLPTATRTVYLDFIGLPAFGGYNNNDGNGPYNVHGPAGLNDPVPPFDIDGDPTTFSSKPAPGGIPSEQQSIRDIWNWVAEKFSPFNVNVTTVASANPDVRVVIGGSDNDWLQKGAGGTSKIGSYGVAPTNTCFVFAADSIAFNGANDPTDWERFIGESAAHESGHEFGLVHERTPSGGPKPNEYYPGDAVRAPIMGGSSNNTTARGTWWKTNIYSGQNSPDSVQDELDVLAGSATSPLSFRTDDHPDGSPGSLTFDNNGIAGPLGGIIEHEGDADAWNFFAPGPAATFTVSGAQFGGMLAPNARIYNVDTGVQVPATYTTSNTNIIVSTQALVGGQRYALEVSGTGGYGNIGQYTITGVLQTPARYDAPTRTLSVGGFAGDNSVSIYVFGDQIWVTDDYTGGSFTQTFPWANVDHVNVALGVGNNTITLNPLEAYDHVSGAGPEVFVRTGGANSTLVLKEDYNAINAPVGDFNVNTPNDITFVTTPVNFGGVSRVELHGASGNLQTTNNNFYVHAWTRSLGTRLYVYGSGKFTDKLTIDASVADNAGGLITFNGATTDGGTDTGQATITVDDRANLGGIRDGSGEDVRYIPKTFSISELGIFGNATGGFREIDLANVTNINLLLGRGIALGAGPTVSIDGERAGQNINVYGNANDISTETFTVGSTDPHGFPELSSPFTDAIRGNVFLYGNGGGNNLTIDDRDHAGSASYTLTGNSLHSNTGGGTVYWDGVNFPEVDFYGSNAGSTMTASGFDSAVPVHLFGGSSGADYLTIDDHLMANRKPNRFDLYQDKVTRFFASSPTFESIYYSGYEAINGYLNDVETTVNVYGVPTLGAGQQATITGGVNADTFTVYPRDAAGNPTVLGNLGIIGGAGADVLNFIDNLATTGTTWSVTNPFGTGTQDFAVTGGVLMGVLNDVESIVLYASPGNDTFNVNTYKAGNAFAIFGGTGDDTLNFGNNNLVTNVTSLSGFSFDGQGGSDTFNLNSAGDGTGTYTAGVFSPGVGIVSYVPTLGSYSIGLLDTNTELTRLYPSGAGPIINVTGVVAGTTTAALMGSNASPAGLHVGSGNTLNTIQGAVIFDGGTAGSSVSVNDSADGVGRIAHLTQTTLGAFPGDTLFPAGGSLMFTNTRQGFTPGLTLSLGSGADTVFAQPNAAGTVTITGGNPTAAPGDTLNLALAAAQGYALHGNAASGNVTSANLKTLTYSGFEAGPNVDAVAPVVAAADINLNGVPAGGAAPVGLLARAAAVAGNRQSLDVVFSEDVAFPAGPAAIVLTNLTTGQDVPQGYVAVAFDPATHTAHFTFPGYPNGELPDGNYRGRLLASGAADLFGNAPVADVPIEFFFLAGDANHDRSVDFNDLVALAQNYNTSDKTFAKGDFNYDGNVDFSDLVILAQRYNTKLAQPPAAATAAVAPVVSAVRASAVAKARKMPVFSVTRVARLVKAREKLSALKSAW